MLNYNVQYKQNMFKGSQTQLIKVSVCFLQINHLMYHNCKTVTSHKRLNFIVIFIVFFFFFFYRNLLSCNDHHNLVSVIISYGTIKCSCDSV